MRAIVLGEAKLLAESGEVELPGGRVGDLLGYLLIAPNEAHSASVLIPYLWPEEPAQSQKGRRRLQVVVSRLRAFLTSGGAEGRGLRLVTDPGGYRLEADASTLDSVRLERLARRAAEGDPGAARAALSLWRGDPFSGLPVTPHLDAARRRLLDLKEVVRVGASASYPDLSPGEKLTRTKLSPPLLRPLNVRRRRLLSKVGRVGEANLFTVCAPAGFGKSVLLSQWASDQNGPVAWVTLERGDRDPARFWSAVLQALSLVEVVDPLELPPAEPGSRHFLGALRDMLGRRALPVGVVIDDCHYLDSDDLSRWVSRYLPLLPPLVTVALAGRSPIELSSSHESDVRRLSAADLRFTEEEIAMLLDRRGSDASQSRTLAELTAGWPVAVSYLSRPEVTPSQASLLSGDLESYVVEEVLGDMDGATSRFLLETAHLEHLNSSLCDAVTGRNDSSNRLDELRSNDYFLISADPDTGWYRYHELVRKVLQYRAALDSEIDVRRLLKRAARWCEEAGMDEEALAYALSAGDEPLVAALSGPVMSDRAFAGQISWVQHTLRSMDPSMVIGSRGSHDTLTFFAAAWLDPIEAQKWVESRRVYGEDEDQDTVAMLVESHQLQVRGRPRRAIELNTRIRSNLHEYIDRHPHSLPLQDVIEKTLEIADLSCRVMASEMTDGDEAFSRLLRSTARYGPAAELWLVGEQAFLSYIDGDSGRAARLIRNMEGHLAALRPQSIELGAPRAVATKALIDSDLSLDLDDQRMLIAQLEPLVEVYERLGWYTDLLPVQLALHVIAYRAADLAAAAEHLRRVDLLLDSFEDVPFLVRARDRLQMSIGDQRVQVPKRDLKLLTERQRVVLELLAAGLTYSEISHALAITPGATRSAIRAIYQKLGVHNRYDATRVFESRE